MHHDDAIRLIFDESWKRAARQDRMYSSVLPKILNLHKIKTYEVSRRALARAALGCGKDFEKLAVFYDNSIDPAKMVGYAAFWIRKIKPIYNAVDMTGNAVDQVNEKASLWYGGLLAEVLVRQRGNSDDLRYYMKKYNDFLQDAGHYEYVIESLSGRTFGPHHYVMWVKSMLPRLPEY